MTTSADRLAEALQEALSALRRAKERHYHLDVDVAVGRAAEALATHDAAKAEEGEIKDALASADPLDRLVRMVLDLLKQRGEFERLAKEALDQRDEARASLSAGTPGEGETGEWRTIDSAPRCVTGHEGDNGRRPVLVTRSPHNGPNAPIHIARLTSRGWMSGRRYHRLWFEPTHWRPLPEPPK